MDWGSKAEWTVSSFGEPWRIWLVPVFEHYEPGPSRADVVGRDNPLGALLYSGFDDAGAVSDEIAIPLLKVYDALTGRAVLQELDDPSRPTNDPRGVLRGFERELSQAIYDAVELGRLRFERVVPAPWAFVDQESKVDVPAPEPVVDERTTFIALRVVDQDGTPVPRRGVQIVFRDQSERAGFLDSDGRLRFDGVPPGKGRVTFVDLDRSDFSPPFVAKGTEPSDAVGPIVLDAEPESGFAHSVEEGETLSSIAGRFGFLHFATLWSHAANAPLRAGRASPHVLLAGDDVVVPDKDVPTFNIQTDTETTFKIFVERLQLKLYAITISGVTQQLSTGAVSGDRGDVAAKGEPDGLTIEIPLETTMISLGELPELPCEVGAMPPIREAGGVEGRLENLGLFVTRVATAASSSEEEDASGASPEERVSLALELFEDAQGEKPTGTRSPEVLATLQDAAGA